jgi:hypothetical protein
MSKHKFNWRDHLDIHPAAELFPLMSEAELKELADDIKANGLQTPIILWFENVEGDDDVWYQKKSLLDGRNRLDALALLGWLEVHKQVRKDSLLTSPTGLRIKEAVADTCELSEETLCVGGDPYAVALSLNVHRRHLTAEQKRELIAKRVKAKPEASNRQIAEQVQADHKTVGDVRSKLEATGEIPQLKKTTGKDGKARKQRNSRRRSHPELPAQVRVSGRVVKTDDFSPAAQEQIAKALEETPAEECPDCDTPQDFWQRSLSNLAGDSITMEALWKRLFGDWEKFEVTSDLVTLAEQAAEAWSKLAANLRSRDTRRDAA